MPPPSNSESTTAVTMEIEMNTVVLSVMLNNHDHRPFAFALAFTPMQVKGTQKSQGLMLRDTDITTEHSLVSDFFSSFSHIV